MIYFGRLLSSSKNQAPWYLDSTLFLSWTAFSCHGLLPKDTKISRLHSCLFVSQGLTMTVWLLKEPAIQTVCIDLCDIEATLKTVESIGDIHLLVNNAGIAILGPFEEAKPEDFDKYVDCSPLSISLNIFKLNEWFKIIDDNIYYCLYSELLWLMHPYNIIWNGRAFAFVSS